ncbi:MAG: helix-turn-helix domain-containing protein, partial [Candidatus Aenigmarchaeota archaeon]|nr:helix-turn-helix domain-containing protein [Candidatus Aenigmarchaeota archaeon]
MNTKILEEVGFTPKEIEVYLVILGLKTSPIFEIMSKANVSRQSIYEILQKLLNKGLISYITKDRKKQYYASNPERITDVIREQEILLKEKEVALQTLLPELLKRYRQNKEETKFEIFVGKEGMKTVNNNLLKVGKEIYILSNEGKIYDFLRYYMP